MYAKRRSFQIDGNVERSMFFLLDIEILSINKAKGALIVIFIKELAPEGISLFYSVRFLLFLPVVMVFIFINSRLGRDLLIGQNRTESDGILNKKDI